MASGATITMTGGTDMQQVVVGDTIQTGDFNNPRVNVGALLDPPVDIGLGGFTLSSTFGYNQGGTGVTAVNVGDVISAAGASGFKNLQDEVQELQVFLNQTAETVTDVTVGDTMTAATFNSLMLAIEDCWYGRFGHTPSAASSGTSDTYTTTWGVAGASEKLTTTCTYTFANENACRAYFNGGGYLGVGAMSMTGTGHNADWNTVVAAAGDVMINYNSNTGTEANTGFYELATTDTTIYSANLGGVYTGDLFTIAVKVNSTTNPTVITFTVVMDDADDNNIDETLDGDFTIANRRRLPNTTGTTYTFPIQSDTISFAVTAT